MQDVIPRFWKEIEALERVLTLRLEIHGTQSNITLNKSNFFSMSYAASTSGQSSLDVGTAMGKLFNFTAFDESGKIRAVGLGGATVFVYMGVSDIEVFMGKFYINEVIPDVVAEVSKISCNCFDLMYLFDVPYVSLAHYPIYLSDMLIDVCQVAGVRLASSEIKNSAVLISERPEGLTCREVLQYIAALAGSFATIRRDELLELKWYIETEYVYPRRMISSIEVAEAPVQFTGVQYDRSSNASILAGDEGYVLKLSQNPLIDYKSDEEIGDILSVIFQSVSGIIYYPATLDTWSNFVIDCGDIITFTRRDGTTGTAIISGLNMNNLNKASINSAGNSEERQRFLQKGIRSSTVSQIIRQVEVINREKLPGITDAIIRTTEFLTTAFGGNIYIPEEGNPYGLETGQIFIMNDTNPLEATQVWVWNLNGLGYSNTGINGPFDIAITMDGSIVADSLYTAQGTFVHLVAGESTAQRMEMGYDQFNDPYLRIYNNNGENTLSLQKDGMVFNDRHKMVEYQIGSRRGIGFFIG